MPPARTLRSPREAGAESDATAMPGDPRLLLRRLVASDERCLGAALVTTPKSAHDAAPALDRKARALVRLGALLAVGAPTASLRWAVDVASAAGADDDALVGVLASISGAAGAAGVVDAAPRLALALGFDVELSDRDEP